MHQCIALLRADNSVTCSVGGSVPLHEEASWTVHSPSSPVAQVCLCTSRGLCSSVHDLPSPAHQVHQVSQVGPCSVLSHEAPSLHVLCSFPSLADCLQLPTPFTYLPLVSLLASVMTGRTILSSCPTSPSIWLNSVYASVAFTSPARRPKGLTLFLSLSYWRKGFVSTEPWTSYQGCPGLD